MIASVIILSIVLTQVVFVWAFWVLDASFSEATAKAFLVAALLWIVVVAPTIKYAGVLPNYSHGEYVGYITKLSYKGVIWKTWEGQLQVGVGEMAALQGPFAFSFVDNENVLKQVNAVLGTGERVKVEYRRWFVMPWSVGDSGYELLAIEPIT